MIRSLPTLVARNARRTLRATPPTAAASAAAAQGALGRTLALTRGFASATRPLLAAGHAVPRPTAERDPTLQRNPNFARLTPDDVRHFQSILSHSPSAVLYADGSQVTSDDLLPYNMDWMRKYRGQSSLVLRPQSTQQVSAILKHCHARALAVVPQGGNTGLVGGSVPVFDEIILHLGGLNKIRSFDAVSGVITVDAGCILEVVDEYLAKHGHMMPLDLGAKGSCQIGGNLATNAGGLRVLRYGSLRGSVLGVEAVLPNGDVLDTLVPLRKDNTGLDLKQLMIGAEGTLGVITAASILAPVRPNATHVAVIAVPDYAGVQAAFLNARTMLGETLSAFEFWDTAACELVDEHLSHVRHPLETRDKVFNVLVETAGADAEHNMAKLETYLEKLMEDGVAVDGAVAQDQAQALAIWSVREGIPEACSKAGAVFKYDVSVPVPDLYDLVEATRARLAELKVPGILSVIGYGHVGDGNLHLNVAAEDYTKEVTNALEPFVYEWVAAKRGSISAEHGLGLMKPKHLHYSKSKEAIELMQRIKQVVDPKGIMNPYKYLPDPAKQ